MLGVMGHIKLKFILDSLIRSKGISARQLSKDTGIAQSTLSNYLQGKGIQKPEHLVKLAEYFSTSIDYLLTGKERKAPSLEEALTEKFFDGYLKVKLNGYSHKTHRGKRRPITGEVYAKDIFHAHISTSCETRLCTKSSNHF